MRVLERYFVDMYDYDSNVYYNDISDYDTQPYVFWTIDLEVDSLYSGFDGRVYLLGVF